MSQNSFFSTFLKASFNEKVNIISLIILYSAISVLTIPVAIIFKEPIILCKDPSTSNQFICSEVEACSNNYIYEINKEIGVSLSTRFELICENSSQKRMALTLLFLGYLIAAMMQIGIIIEAKKRKLSIFLGALITVLSLVLILAIDILEMDFQWMYSLFFFNGVGFVIINTYSFMWVSENLKGDILSLTIILLLVGWASMGSLFSILGYFFDANWKALVIFSIILSSISGIVFFMTKDNNNNNNNNNKINNNINNNNNENEYGSIIEEENVENFGILSYLRDMWPNKSIRMNFIFYTLVWDIYAVVYGAQYVELESVGGNIYMITIFCSCFEVATSFFAGIITKVISCDKLLKGAISIEAIVFLFFFAAPLSINTAPSGQVFFFVICLLIAKICNDTINLMIYLSLPKIFTDKYVGFFLIVSRGSCRILMIFLPTVNYLVRSLSFHPFVLYGVLFIFCRILLTFCKEVQTEGMDDLMNDTNINVMQRVAIASAGHSIASSLDHDDILKNIHVDGVKLSSIKKSRKKIDSIKKGSSVFKSSVQKENVDIKLTNLKSNFFELRESFLKIEKN